jgi:hypothetical protein
VTFDVKAMSGSLSKRELEKERDKQSLVSKLFFTEKTTLPKHCVEDCEINFKKSI